MACIGPGIATGSLRRSCATATVCCMERAVNGLKMGACLAHSRCFMAPVSSGTGMTTARCRPRSAPLMANFTGASKLAA